MPTGSTPLRFNVLGPLEAWHDDVRITIPAGRSGVLLATLLLHANQPVPVDALVDRLREGGAPNPGRVKATLQMVVRRLRQALGDANVVRATTNGYVAEVDPEALDPHRFRELAANGEYAEALGLWRGEPLLDVRSDLLHAEEVEPLLEERLVVLERRIEADLLPGVDDMRAVAYVSSLAARVRLAVGRPPTQCPWPNGPTGCSSRWVRVSAHPAPSRRSPRGSSLWAGARRRCACWNPRCEYRDVGAAEASSGWSGPSHGPGGHRTTSRRARGFVRYAYAGPPRLTRG